AMQEAEVTPTAAQVASVARARTDAKAVMDRWTAIKTRDLAALNAKRKAAGEPAVTIPPTSP
ncbi:MAG TPA: hypothetical protein VFJ20_09125, partial [Gemmatimonadaceae bacterium]|nr:hypothetical protein [Gemmatimonadaceae bacterium]